MNFIINVLRVKEKTILSSPIKCYIPARTKYWALVGASLGWGATTKNISVNILAVTFQASNQDTPKSN